MLFDVARRPEAAESRMLRRIDLRGRAPGTIEIRGLLPRAPIDVESVLESVRPICDDVLKRGAPEGQPDTAAS